MNMNIFKLSWSDYYLLNQKLIGEVKNKYSDYRILGVSRGGLIPATLLSHQTNQLMDIINVSSYIKNHQNDIIFKNDKIWDNEIPQKILIVDDLIDSGNTIFKIWKKICNEINKKNLILHDFSIKFVVLIDKSESIITPDFASTKMTDPCWIEFPYERK